MYIYIIISVYKVRKSERYLGKNIKTSSLITDKKDVFEDMLFKLTPKWEEVPSWQREQPLRPEGGWLLKKVRGPGK